MPEHHHNRARQYTFNRRAHRLANRPRLNIQKQTLPHSTPNEYGVTSSELDPAAKIAQQAQQQRLSNSEIDMDILTEIFRIIGEKGYSKNELLQILRDIPERVEQANEYERENNPDIESQLDQRAPHVNSTPSHAFSKYMRLSWPIKKWNISREYIYEILSEPKTPVGKHVQICMAIFVILSMFSLCLETMEELNRTIEWHYFWIYCKIVFLVVFGSEWIIRAICYTTKPWITFLKSPLNIFDLIGTVPFLVETVITFTPVSNQYVTPFHVLRPFRIFRFAKFALLSPQIRVFAKAMGHAKDGLILVSSCFLICLLVFSSFVFYVEIPYCTFSETDRIWYREEGGNTYVPCTYQSIVGALWWCVVTLSTTGYGDIIPQTPPGRVVAGLTMITGLVLFSTSVSLISNALSSLHEESQIRKILSGVHRHRKPDTKIRVKDFKETKSTQGSWETISTNESQFMEQRKQPIRHHSLSQFETSRKIEENEGDVQQDDNIPIIRHQSLTSHKSGLTNKSLRAYISQPNLKGSPSPSRHQSNLDHPELPRFFRSMNSQLLIHNFAHPSAPRTATPVEKLTLALSKYADFAGSMSADLKQREDELKALMLGLRDLADVGKFLVAQQNTLVQVNEVRDNKT